jgi:hypothetical protein
LNPVIGPCGAAPEPAPSIGLPDTEHPAILFLKAPGRAKDYRMATRLVWVACALAAFSARAVAHHGTLISYDRAKQWTREAVVTSFHYANPHPQLFFDITSEAGAVESWAAELLPNPAALIRNGWTRARSVDALKPGTTVRITIAPSKAGGTVGLVLQVTDLEGNALVTDGLPPPGPPPSATAPARP